MSTLNFDRLAFFDWGSFALKPDSDVEFESLRSVNMALISGECFFFFDEVVVSLCDSSFSLERIIFTNFNTILKL